MIKKMEVKDIVQILHQDNPDMIGVDLGQFVQILIQNVDNNKMLMIADIKEGTNKKNAFDEYAIISNKNKRILALYITDSFADNPDCRKMIILICCLN